MELTVDPNGEQLSVGWNFDNSYAGLPDTLFVRTRPVPVRAPRIVLLNHELASAIGLNLSAMLPEQAARIFAGNELPQGADPIAQAYAGHQYGGFTMLGDGRAILLGEQITPTGLRCDIQLKGSGQTPFSRRGDGRAALGPMLREYIISEAMAAFGVPTTRSLAVVATGEAVYRETTLPGAILTRVAASHIRVGTFEYLAAREDHDNLKKLADYTIQRHYPEVAHASNPYLELLRSTVARQASLIASWQLIGFIHGVMNTDNMAISGETIDYGPCAFMDAYDSNTVFSSIDQYGRYAYGNQPKIAQWNLARFAESLLPLMHDDQATAIEIATIAVQEFTSVYEARWLSGMRRKLGLSLDMAGDSELIQQLLAWMQHAAADFTNTFRDLAHEPLPSADIYQDAAFVAWYSQWNARRSLEPTSRTTSSKNMLAANPAVIPRNHRVEEAIEAAVEREDLSVFEKLLSALREPYADGPDHQLYRLPPEPSSQVYQTFCGT